MQAHVPKKVLPVTMRTDVAIGILPTYLRRNDGGPGEAELRIPAAGCFCNAQAKKGQASLMRSFFLFLVSLPACLLRCIHTYRPGIDIHRYPTTYIGRQEPLDVRCWAMIGGIE